MRTIATLSIAAAGLALVAGANFLIANDPPDSTPIMPEARLPGTAETAAPSDAPILGVNVQLTYSQTRPLFIEGRRPWVTPAVEVQAAPVDPEPFVTEEPAAAPDPIQPPPSLSVSLLGVQKDIRGAKALIATGANPDATWIRTGEIVDGWTVTAIDNESVNLTLGNQATTVELYSQSPASQANEPL